MCQAHAYFMETQRLGFRRWSMDDLPLAMALWADPEVTRLFGGPFSDEAARERLAREIDSMHTHKFQYWPVFLHAKFTKPRGRAACIAAGRDREVPRV